MYWETPDEEENPFLDSSYHGEVNDNEISAKEAEDAKNVQIAMVPKSEDTPVN